MVFDKIVNTLGIATKVVFDIQYKLYGTQAKLYRPQLDNAEAFLAKSFKSQSSVPYSYLKDIKIIPVTIYNQTYTDISADYYQEIEVFTDDTEVQAGDKLEFTYLDKNYSLKIVDIDTFLPSDRVLLKKLICKG